MKTLHHTLLALTAAILLATPLAASAQDAGPGTGIARIPLPMFMNLARVAAIEPAGAETRSRATLPLTPLRQGTHAARPPAGGAVGRIVDRIPRNPSNGNTGGWVRQDVRNQPAVRCLTDGYGRLRHSAATVIPTPGRLPIHGLGPGRNRPAPREYRSRQPAADYRTAEDVRYTARSAWLNCAYAYRNPLRSR